MDHIRRVAPQPVKLVLPEKITFFHLYIILYLDTIIYAILFKNFVLPQLVGQALTSKGPGLPVVYLCLNAGKDAVTRPVTLIIALECKKELR